MDTQLETKGNAEVGYERSQLCSKLKDVFYMH